MKTDGKTMVASRNIVVTGKNKLVTGKKLSISSYNISIMEFVSNMTKAQKEQYVIELYKQDKKIIEIIQRVHMSPRDVCVIIKKVKLQLERERGQLEEKDDYDIESKSKITQAIKMFSEGKTPVDVVIELDLPADEVQEIYRQFLGLKNMHKLVEVYDEMQNYLPSLLELFRIIESRGINKNDIIDVLKIINTGQLPYLQKKVTNLTYGIDWLENEIKKKRYTLSILHTRTRELTYRGDELYPMNNSTKDLIYRADKIYPTLMEDKTIRLLSSNISLVRRNDTYKSIDSLANEILDASADWVENRNNCL